MESYSSLKEVDLSNYTIIDKLSKWGNDKVYKVQEKETGEIFVAKVINCHNDPDICESIIKNKIKIMTYCNHPTIIKLAGYSKYDFDEENNITILTEFFHNKSIYDVIDEYYDRFSEKYLSNTIKYIILIGVAKGMKYMHDYNIINGNLKSGNILLDEKFHPKITNYILPKFMEKDFREKDYRVEYFVPTIQENKKLSQKSDVYLFGILMYEVLTGSITFRKSSQSFNNYLPIIRDGIEKNLKKLMIQCWSPDPNERPTFEEIFNKLIKKNEKTNKYLLDEVNENEIISYLKEIDDNDDKFSNFQNKMKIIEEVNRTYYDDEKMIIIKKIKCSEYLFFMEINGHLSESIKRKEELNIIQAIMNDNVNVIKENSAFIMTNDFILIDIRLYNIKEKPYRKDEYKSLPLNNLGIFHLAAYFNSLKCFQYIEKELHISLIIPTKDGFIPLYYACFNGSIDVVKYILDRSPEQAKFNIEKQKKISLFMCAIRSQKSEIIEELIKNGNHISDKMNDEALIIEMAIGCQNLEILKTILKYKSPNLTKNNNNWPFSYVSLINRNIPSFEIFYNGREDILFNDIGFDYLSIISVICFSGDKIFKPTLMRILDDAIKENISIEPPNQDGIYYSGVCHWICQYYDIDVAKKMLQTKDVLINRFNRSYKTGAFYLYLRNEPQTYELFNLLIENGLDINIRKNEDSPSFLEQLINGIIPNYDLIEFLIKKGADVNAICSKQKITLYQKVQLTNDIRMKQIFNIS